MKKKFYILIIIMLVIPLAGELKIYPFHDTYRVSFGIPIFFFFLLSVRKISPILSGFMVAVCVVIFRIVLNLIHVGNFQVIHAFMINFPAFFYYLTYSILFYIICVKYLNHHLLLGFLSALIEISSSMVEILIRHIFLGDYINITIFIRIVIIAIIRSFFVLGFFNIIKLHEKELEVERQQEQNRSMAILISNLYEESIQLKKSLLNAEHITRNCYDLYRNLRNSKENIDANEISQSILSIAGEIHEIKKDNQRIYAGLSKMILNGNSNDYMNIDEIIHIVVNTNQKYADSLSKNINFVVDIEKFDDLVHTFILLSILNNLVSNSVEAIKNNGFIKIYVHKLSLTNTPNFTSSSDPLQYELIQFKISDNGIGIPDKKKTLIFKPGYTTKYDNTGKPSTGIGLSYVSEIVNNLNGTLELQSKNSETYFIINLPIRNLRKS